MEDICRSWQLQIRSELGVSAAFDLEAELARRSAFLVQSLADSGARALVLGISGGVDSLAAGLLAQHAVRAARARGLAARFIAVRLPYGAQRDEADAQACMDVIGADQATALDIKPATDAMAAALAPDWQDLSAAKRDFLLGNIKARQRMLAQYALAGAAGGLVLGTDHAAESLMGYFTKFGDGAADLMPLHGLNKRRVRALARRLGAPEPLVMKTPTADLELLRPLLPDEESFGVSYEQIDDFLEGKPIAPEAQQIILRHYLASAHKRRLPATP